MTQQNNSKVLLAFAAVYLIWGYHKLVIKTGIADYKSVKGNLGAKSGKEKMEM